MMTEVETTKNPKFCLRKCCSKTALLLTSVVLILLIMLSLLVIWVATGPRSLEQFTPQITEEVNAKLDGYTMELEDIQLAWNSWESPLDVRFLKVKLYSPEQQLLANLEQVAVSADMLALAVGTLELDRVTIYKPTINVYRKADGTFMLDLGIDTAYGPELPPELANKHRPGTITEHLQRAGLPDLLGLSEFNIRGGVVNYGDTRRGIIARLREVNFDADIDSDEIEVEASAGLLKGDAAAGTLQLSVDMPLDSLAAAGWVKFRELNLPALSRIAPELAPLNTAQFLINGNAEFGLSKIGALSHGKFDIAAGEGLIDTEQLKEPLSVKSARVKGYIPSENIVVVEKLVLETPQTTLSGQLKLTKTIEEQFGISTNIQMTGMPASHVENLWPLTQSPVSRDWVTGNITSGEITGISLKIDIEPGMLMWEKLPNEAVDAEIKFQNAAIKFHPKFDKATGVNGVVKVNANQLDVDVLSARYMTTAELSNGGVFIGDLNADNPELVVDFSVKMPAKNLATILSSPALDLAEEINLTEDNVSGDVFGKAKISFPFDLPRDKKGNPDWNAIDYDIGASLQNVSQSGFLGEYDLSEATGELTVIPKKIEFVGTSNVFNVPLQIDVLHKLRGKEAVRTSIKTAGNVSDAFLRKFGVETAPYIQGDIAMNADIKIGVDDTVSVTASMDLISALVDIKELNWQKPVGTASSLKLVGKDSVSGVHLSSVDFKSAANVFEGSLSLDSSGNLTQITATKLTLGPNDLQLSYTPIISGHKIYATGNYFDASGFFDEEDDFSFKEIPALDVKVDLKKLVLDDGRYIEDLTGTATCNPTICTSVAMSGKVQGAKPALMSIGYESDVRRLSVTSEDAGGLLKGLNVYDNMEGGRMDIAGVFDDKDPNHPLNGKLHIWGFQVNNTPTLARIVTLASFGGIVDALQGNGLRFKKLKSKFVLKNDIINVTGLRATGDSIGITAEGEINLVVDKLFLKGVVIPSYTINSFLKNVPIVGDILTGGEAIIAANYKVSGDMEDPDVSVNPLSALAPGFLRKIFE